MGIRDAKDIVHSMPGTARKGAIDESFDPTRLTILGDRLLVRRDAGRDKTDGGLFIPDTAIEPKFTGVVVAKGADCATGGLDVGSRVLFGKYSGAELSIAGSAYAMMNEADVMAIIREGDPIELE